MSNCHTPNRNLRRVVEARHAAKSEFKNNSLNRSASSGVFGILGHAAGVTGDDQIVISRRNLHSERASVRTNQCLKLPWKCAYRCITIQGACFLVGIADVD